MPAYAALFDGSPDRPKQEARDLVAYIESLGRARELAWPEGDLLGREKAGDNKWAMMSLESPILNRNPAKTQRGEEYPLLSIVESNQIANNLWLDNCAGCHGENGRGDGPAAKWLEPMPANLSEREFSLEKLSDVLWNGVHNTAMPAWRDHSEENRSLLAAVVRGFSLPQSSNEISEETLETGSSIYKKHCAECHGDHGDGNGFAAKQFPIVPSNFKSERVSMKESVRILKNGVKGTSMAPWGDRLTESEIIAVSRYIRQFFEKDDHAEAVQ